MHAKPALHVHKDGGAAPPLQKYPAAAAVHPPVEHATAVAVVLL